MNMKKQKVTVLAIEHSKKVCDPQPESIDRRMSEGWLWMLIGAVIIRLIPSM